MWQMRNGVFSFSQTREKEEMKGREREEREKEEKARKEKAHLENKTMPA